jgi:voltage-dependent calcium channel L type alpha-1S
MIFTVEIVIRVIAKGVILNGPESYLLSYWNALDLLIVILSLASLSMNTSKLKVFKVLRMIRILRPLRVISRNDGLKLAV